MRSISSIRIASELIIDADRLMAVEDIIAEVEHIDVGFREDIADTLFARFRDIQTLTANHHSVLIETTARGKSSPLALKNRNARISD